MNATEARHHLSRPLRFGDREQIEALRLIADITEFMQCLAMDDDDGEIENCWRSMCREERISAVQSFGDRHLFSRGIIREACRDIENWSKLPCPTK